MERIFITPEQAISILPDKSEIHTYRTTPMALLGCDSEREHIIEKINSTEVLELAGEVALSMGHGLAIYNKDIKWQSGVLFIETDMDKLKQLEGDLAEGR